MKLINHTIKVLIVLILLISSISTVYSEETELNDDQTLLDYFKSAQVLGNTSKLILDIGQSFPLDEAYLDWYQGMVSKQIDLYHFWDLKEKNIPELLAQDKLSFWSLEEIRAKKVQFAAEIQDNSLTWDKYYNQELLKNPDWLSTGFEILGLALDAYDAGENIGQLIEGDGSVAINSLQLSQNAYSIVTNSLALVATIAPKGTISQLKLVSFFKSAKTLNKVNFLISAAQLNSVVYSYFRDSSIEETKANTAKEYASTLTMRNLIYQQLVSAYLDDYNLSRGEIGTILNTYPRFSPFGSDEITTLSSIFHEYMENSFYLQARFDILDQEDSTGLNRVSAALDALAKISVLEDQEIESRLDESISAFPEDASFLTGLQNVIAGAFSGEDAYKIFNTEDFKLKMIPSHAINLLDNTDLNYYTFYRAMYNNMFRGDIGTNIISEVEELGELVKRLKSRSEQHTAIIGVMNYLLNDDIEKNQNINLAKGLVAHYKFESDSSDSSGNENDGSNHGGLNYLEGVIGMAASFDGVDDYIYINHTEKLNISTDYSFSFWVNRTNDGGVQNIISKGRDCNNSYFFRTGGQMFAVTYGNSWCDHQALGSPFPINEWHHIVGTLDSMNNNIKYYLDGVLVDEKTIPPYSTTNTYPLILGRHFTYSNGGGGYTYNFAGKLDELRLYDRILDQSEINLLYNLPTKN